MAHLAWAIPMMSRSAAGRKAKKEGRSWEHQLLAALNAVPRSLVVKVGTPIRRTGGSGKGFTAVYSKRSTVDIVGICGGLPIFVEAKKTTTKTRFNLGVVKPHQRTDLARAHAAGAVSGLAVYSSSLDRAWWIPEPALAVSAKSLRFEDLDRLGLCILSGGTWAIERVVLDRA